MKYLLFILPFALLISCKKEVVPNNGSSITLLINGKERNGSGIANFQISYQNGAPSSYQTNLMFNGGYVYITDSFTPGDTLIVAKSYGSIRGIVSTGSNIYLQDQQTLGSNNVSSLSNGNGNYLNLSISSKTSALISGTFTGFFKGVSSSGSVVSDTITSGVFTNIPITRIFQ